MARICLPDQVWYRLLAATTGISRHSDWVGAWSSSWMQTPISSLSAIHSATKAGISLPCSSSGILGYATMFSVGIRMVMVVASTASTRTVGNTSSSILVAPCSTCISPSSTAALRTNLARSVTPLSGDDDPLVLEIDGFAIPGDDHQTHAGPSWRCGGDRVDEMGTRRREDHQPSRSRGMVSQEGPSHGGMVVGGRSASSQSR